jgi:hypothetical protein
MQHPQPIRWSTRLWPGARSLGVRSQRRSRGGCPEPAGRGAQARSGLAGIPKPEPASTPSLRPRNALRAACLTQDDATQLEAR